MVASSRGTITRRRGQSNVEKVRGPGKVRTLGHSFIADIVHFRKKSDHVPQVSWGGGGGCRKVALALERGSVERSAQLDAADRHGPRANWRGRAQGRARARAPLRPAARVDGGTMSLAAHPGCRAKEATKLRRQQEQQRQQQLVCNVCARG